MNGRIAVVMHLLLSLLYVLQPFSITSNVIVGMTPKISNEVSALYFKEPAFKEIVLRIFDVSTTATG